MTIGRSDAERFWSHVDKNGPNGCWLWTGSGSGKATHLYGNFIVGKWREGIRRILRAHRFAYELLVGPIPDGLVLDHLCRVTMCVNPSHLEPVTHAENMRRGVETTKTHCVHGHEFTLENTYLNYRPSGIKRTCRACHRRNAALHVARKKAA